jgi:lipid-A-disaccharide synthase
LYEDAIKRCGVDIKICESDAYNILGAADSAIVASGTATLETAIIGTPFIITYRANFVNYIAYLIVAKKRVLGLVNWIAQSIVVPELLQYDATPSKLAAATLGLLRDSARRSDMLAALKRVRESLGPPGASARAARAILPYVQ